MSKTCPNCNNVFDDSYNICPRCGMQYIAPAQPMPGQPNAPYNQPGMPYGQPAQPYYNQPAAPAEQPMTVGQWLGTILLTTCLGTISLILLFVWGFSNTTPTSKKNYCRAMLIVNAIGIALVIIFFIIFVAAMSSSGELSEIFREAFKELTVYRA